MRRRITLPRLPLRERGCQLWRDLGSVRPKHEQDRTALDREERQEVVRELQLRGMNPHTLEAVGTQDFCSPLERGDTVAFVDDRHHRVVVAKGLPHPGTRNIPDLRAFAGRKVRPQSRFGVAAHRRLQPALRVVARLGREHLGDLDECHPKHIARPGQDDVEGQRKRRFLLCRRRLTGARLRHHGVCTCTTHFVLSILCQWHGWDESRRTRLE